MARNMNTVALIGRLTKDPELRQTPSGFSVTTLRIAVNDRTKQGDEWVDTVGFYNVVVWGRQAENACDYLEKGRQVGVTGRLTWREWERDGVKREQVEIAASAVEFLSQQRSEDGYMPERQPRTAPADEWAPSGNDWGSPEVIRDSGPGSDDGWEKTYGGEPELPS
jgi:single-strand DNA-binding protein